MASITTRNTSAGLVFQARIRIKGAKPVSAVFQRKTDARKWIQSTEAAIRERRYFPDAAANRHTLADAIDRYLDELPQRQLCDERNRRQILIWWRAQIGYLRLSDVTSDWINAQRVILQTSPVFPNSPHLRAPRRQRAPATVNRYLAALSCVFSAAKREWNWAVASPLDNLRRCKEPRGRVRWLERDEIARLRAACAVSGSHVLVLVMELALATGMRRSEILTLRWEDVDLERSQLILSHTKNGDRRTIPLVAHVVNLMLDHAERCQGEGYVFVGANASNHVDIRKAWTNAVRRATLTELPTKFRLPRGRV